MSISVYQSGLDRFEQEEIVRDFLPKIKAWVLRISGRLPANVDTDDLYSAACMGLVESMQRFDKGQKTLISTCMLKEELRVLSLMP